MATNRIRPTFGIAVIAAVAVLAIGQGLATAASPGATTRGEAEAAFHAFTGGLAIRNHHLNAQGAPLQGATLPGPDGARILSFYPDQEYCAQGWHVISANLFYSEAELLPFGVTSKKQLMYALALTDVQWILDGVPLTVERTPIRQLTNLGFPDYEPYGLTFGTFMPPGSLSVGTHTLQETFTVPDLPAPETDSNTFTILDC